MDRRLERKLKRIEQLQEEANDIAVDIVIKEARRILNEDNDLFEFVMAMGSCFFTIKDGGRYDTNDMTDEEYEEWCYSDGYINVHNGIAENDHHQHDFFKLVDDLDENFGVTGYPVRFTANSERVHDWGDTIKDPVIYIQRCK